MSVDVEPDGQHIVFDLLGDIYLLPIAGGAKQSLNPQRRLGYASAFLAGW